VVSLVRSVMSSNEGGVSNGGVGHNPPKKRDSEKELTELRVLLDRMWLPLAGKVRKDVPTRVKRPAAKRVRPAPAPGTTVIQCVNPVTSEIVFYDSVLDASRSRGITRKRIRYCVDYNADKGACAWKMCEGMYYHRVPLSFKQEYERYRRWQSEN
jgi:hypothetical protein